MKLAYRFKKMNILFLPFDQLTSQQLLSLYKLRSDVFVVEQKCIYPDPDITDIDAVHVLMEDTGLMAAYARIYFDGSAHIGRVIVSESHRQKGISKTLMNACIDWIKTQEKSTSIKLSAQVYLSDFYTKLGFNIKGSMYLEDGIPHLEMSYQL